MDSTYGLFFNSSIWRIQLRRRLPSMLTGTAAKIAISKPFEGRIRVIGAPRSSWPRSSLVTIVVGVKKANGSPDDASAGRVTSAKSHTHRRRATASDPEGTITPLEGATAVPTMLACSQPTCRDAQVTAPAGHSAGPAVDYGGP